MVFVSQSLILAVVVSLGVCSQVLATPKAQKPVYDIEDAEYHFKEFMVKYNKQYETSEQMQRRLHIFKENLKKINMRNAETDETAIFGINQFTDLEHEEFMQNVSCLKMPSAKVTCTQISKNFTTKYPVTVEESFDWREHNAVTRVKDQGQCGSCWAFAAIGNIEGQYAIKHGSLLEFSEQQVLDCDSLGTCKSGYFAHAITTVQSQGGVEGETDYPYETRKGQCRFNPNMSRAKVSDCNTFQLGSEEELKQALRETGPLAIGVCTSDFNLYQGGILPSCTAGPLNHAVLLTGYGVDPQAGPYWIIKNSWSESFGEKGYIKIKRNVNACNIMAAPPATSAVV